MPRVAQSDTLLVAIGTPVVVGLVVLACISPAIAGGVIGGLAAVILGVARPKLFFAVGMVVLLMQRTIALHVDAAAVDYIDEGFVLSSFVLFTARRLARRERLRLLPGMVPLALFMFVGIASSLANAVPVGIAGQGALLIGKGFFLAWAVAQLDWTPEDLRIGAKIGAWVAGILIIGAAINFVAPGPWTSIVLNGQGYGDRFGLSPVTSFFQHPGYFGSVMALFCLAAFSHLSVFGRTKTALFIVVGSIFAAVLTARRKILVGLLAAIAALGIRLRWIPLAIGIVVGTPLAAILLWDTLASIVQFTYAEYFVNPDAVARVRLTTDAVDLALQSFPAGVGFGRFGSAVARASYSPLYYELGYPSVWGLGPTAENGQFLTDTFWPAIIGETGIIGTLLFIVILAVYLRRFIHLSRHDGGWDRWLGLVGIAWSVQLFIESLAGAIYTAVPTFALFFALVGIAATRPTPIQQRTLTPRRAAKTFR